MWRWPLCSGVTAFTTTRHGGYSQGEYGEMNVNPWVGDDPEAVRKNQQLLCNELGLPDNSHLVIPHQVHGTELLHISSDILSLSPKERTQRLDGIDGVTTDIRGIAIGVSTADCVPILLYDKEHHAASAVHAGWRGCVGRIILKAIRTMEELYGSQANQIKALIGPCIMKQSYQVKADVMEQFRKTGYDVRDFSSPTTATYPQAVAKKPEATSWNLDLVQFCNIELVNAGISQGNILKAQKNTYEQPDNLFSARRQGIASGRLFTGIIL